jgi:alpha-1,2-mannosyltransferase
VLRGGSQARTVVAVVAVALVAALAATLHDQFKDLLVYRYAGRAVLDGRDVYAHDDPVTGLPFTYPPFAAVLMVPVALVPAKVAAVVWAGLSAGAVAVSFVLARRGLGRPTPWWLVVLVGLGAVALEPVWQNYAFGQVNTLLMLAVLADLLRPERRLSGVLVGIAAGVKLTPLVFVVLLGLVGRTRSAGRALVAFVATVALGWVLVSGSAAYWTDDLVEARRVGPPGLAHNQSVYGALTRLLDGPPSSLLWIAVAGPLAIVVVVVGAAWWRRGERVLGTCLGGLAMLVASPVSWSHTWVWALPVAVVLWDRSRIAGAAWALVFVCRPILWPPWGAGREYHWSAVEHLVGNGYLLAALVVAAWAGASLLVNRGAAGTWRPRAFRGSRARAAE